MGGTILFCRSVMFMYASDRAGTHIADNETNPPSFLAGKSYTKVAAPRACMYAWVWKIIENLVHGNQSFIVSRQILKLSWLPERVTACAEQQESDVIILD